MLSFDLQFMLERGKWAPIAPFETQPTVTTPRVDWPRATRSAPAIMTRLPPLQPPEEIKPFPEWCKPTQSIRPISSGPREKNECSRAAANTARALSPPSAPSSCATTTPRLITSPTIPAGPAPCIPETRPCPLLRRRLSHRAARPSALRYHSRLPPPSPAFVPASPSPVPPRPHTAPRPHTTPHGHDPSRRTRSESCD
jgi:hypothetical protein